MRPVNQTANTSEQVESDAGAPEGVSGGRNEPGMKAAEGPSSIVWKAPDSEIQEHSGLRLSSNGADSGMEDSVTRQFKELADCMLSPKISADQISRRIAALPAGSRLPTSLQDFPFVELAIEDDCPITTVRQLIDMGASVEATNQYGFRALYVAVAKNHLDVVRLILKHLPNSPDTKTEIQECLPLAVTKGDSMVVWLLLARGANPALPVNECSSALEFALPGADFKLINILIDYGVKPTSLECAEKLRPKLLLAVAQGNLDFVKRLLAWSGLRTPFTKNLLAHQDANEYSPMNVAAIRGDEMMVLELLLYGASTTHQDAGYTALMHACVNKHPKIVERLLEADLMGNIVNSRFRDSQGLSALGVAVRFGSPEVLQVLLKRALSEVGGIEEIVRDLQGGRYLLMDIFERGDPDMVRLLLRAGLPVNFQLPGWPTLLGMFAASGNVRCVQLMLDSGTDVELRDNHGQSPLLLAVRNGHAGAVRQLLEAGASQVPDHLGWTPLALALGRLQQFGDQPSPYGEIVRLLKRPYRKESEGI